MSHSIGFGSLILAFVLLVSGCIPTSFSGSKVPTEITHRLDATALAEANTDDCSQEWVTGDAVADIETAKNILELAGVRIVEGNPSWAGTALKRKLLVRPGVLDQDPRVVATLLAHELVHYCDRERLGDAVFEQRYALSDWRWAFEVRAYRQSVRSLKAYGGELGTWITQRVESMPTAYWLHDIDPEEFARETRSALESAR